MTSNSATRGLGLFQIIITALLTSSFVLSAPESHDSFPPPNSTDSSILWSSCPPEVTGSKLLQCATFSVPIDWQLPYGEHFQLGLVKLPAALDETFPKVGTLFVNPGGPGGLASELVAAIASGAIKSKAFLSSFDIVGLDPRGVGRSNQVRCDMTILAERSTLYPQTDEELEKLQNKNKRFGESCRKLTGPLLEHIDTISAAKDHEAVRVALGNEPFNYIGMSYGTQLGAQYAALFPDNIRTLALDGIVQHSQTEGSNYLMKATSFALSVSHFLTWASTNDSSALKGQNAEALWTELLSNASTTPIPALSCNNTKCRSDVNAEELLYSTRAYLNFAGNGLDFGSSWGGSWKSLSSALYNASQGDASALSADLTGGAGYASGLAISCLDWTQDASSSLTDISAQIRMMQEYAPLTRGESQTWSLQHACLGWPVKPVNPPKKLDIKTNATVLLTQSTSDPTTGLPWAIGMLEEIKNRVLVLRDGDGHTSLPLGGETAAIVVEYLVTGKAPKDGIVVKS